MFPPPFADDIPPAWQGFNALCIGLAVLFATGIAAAALLVVAPQ